MLLAERHSFEDSWRGYWRERALHARGRPGSIYVGPGYSPAARKQNKTHLLNLRPSSCRGHRLDVVFYGKAGRQSSFACFELTRFGLLVFISPELQQITPAREAAKQDAPLR
jgi:hypothetical protein